MKMAQTLTSLLIHIVFSTKNRQHLIYPEIESNLFSYMGGFLTTITLVCLLQVGRLTMFTCWLHSQKTLRSVIY